MKKILFTLLAAFILLAAFNGCSKKAADKLIGKWATTVEMPIPQSPDGGTPSSEKLKIDVSYEFTNTKTNMNVEIKAPNMTPQKIETTYTVKSDDGNTVVLEVILPENKQKLEFKITITENKMKLVDPNGEILDLTKI